MKKTMILCILLLLLLFTDSVCCALQEHITVVFDAKALIGKSRTRQPRHVSASSQRYCHNQILQKTYSAALCLHTCSADQLAQYFAQHDYSEEQILRHHELYMYPEFIKVAKICPGYEQYILHFNKKLQKKSGFVKWLST